MRSWSPRRLALSALLAAGAAVFSVQTARATTIVVPTDRELLAASRAVVEGRVVDIASRRIEGGRAIYTYVTLDVTRTIAGDVADNRIVLKEFGGTVGDDFSIVWGVPEYAVGERVLVYLNADDDGALHTAFMMVGKFTIISDGGRDVVSRLAAADAVTLLPPLSGGAVTDCAPYEDYVAAIAQQRAAAASLLPNTPYRAVPAEVMLPAAPGDETHHEAFTFLSGRPRWFEPDDGLSVPYYYRPTTFLPDGGQGAVSDALAAWSNVAGCSLRLVLADDTELCGYSRDGQSTVSFDDCRNQVDGGGCFGVIAIGGASGRTTEKKTVNGVEFVRISEGDVVMNNGQQTCLLGHRLTLREVLTHEIGHSIGLGHSSDIGPEPNPRLKEATMYYALHEDDRGASLKPDDEDGVRFIYPDALRPPAIVTESLPTASIGQAYSVALSAEGGEAPYSWQLAAGTLPAGMALGADGVLAGTPTARGVASVTIQVTDGRSRTGTRDLTLEVVGPKPVVASASYRAAKSRFDVVIAQIDAAVFEIRVNGVAVTARIKTKPVESGATRLRVKGSAADLHIVDSAGANSVVVVADGVASDVFAF